MSYRKAFVPIILLVVASMILTTGMNTSIGLAKTDATKVPLPVDETVTPIPSVVAEDWPGPWFKQNSLAGVNYYDHDYGDPLPDMTPSFYGQRGWNVIVVNNSLSDCKYGLTDQLKAALAAKEEHGLTNIVRIDYTQQNGQSIAVPRYSQGEDYIQWMTAFALCVSRFRNYRPSDSKNDEVHDLAKIFIVGNEPDRDGKVYPDEYYLAYNALWNSKSGSSEYSDTQLLVAGPSVFNPEFDPIKWMAEVTQGLKDTDGFAIHTYGIRAECKDPQRPCEWDGGGYWQHDGGFRFYRELIEDGINATWWSRPVYITEFNTSTGGETPEQNYLNGWIQKAFSDVRDYNATRGNKPVIKTLAWFVDKSDGRWDGYSLKRGRDPSNTLLHDAFLDMQTEFHNPANRGRLAALIDETGSTVPLKISPGETRRVTVRVWNTGPTTWQASQSYGLAATSNNQMILSNPNCESTQNGNVTIFKICSNVQPLHAYDFSFDMTMPVNSSGHVELELQMALSTTVDSSRNYLFWFGKLQSWKLQSGNPLGAGRYNACVLTPFGAVKCWGSNNYGALGVRTDCVNGNCPTPMEVLGLPDNIISIAKTGDHACALTSEGAVKCWGYNNYGQLGNNSTVSSSTPVDVFGLQEGVIAIAAGWHHTCAVTSSGGVKCWGYNAYGQLGSGTGDSPIPVDVIGLDSGIIGIAANEAHTCALTNSGGVKCWGYNYYGQLGNGSTADSPVPVDVTGLDSGIVALAPGYTHTCAITRNGGVKCWGSNGIGELGDGTNTQHLTPVDVIELGDRVISLGAGDSHTCAVLQDGGGKCWGMGPLGDGTFQPSSTPVSIINPDNNFAVIASGAFYQWGNEQYYPYTCVLTNMGRGKCWGTNIFGQLGNGTAVDTYELTPGDVVNLP